MKVLLIDTLMYAHHIPYFEYLYNGLNLKCDVTGVLPDNYKNENMNIIHLSFFYGKMKPHKHYVNAYINWMIKLKKIIKKEKPDLIHFLYGDTFYAYFGIALNLLGCKNIIMTFHQIRRGFLRELSLRYIAKQAKTCIVHSDRLKKEFNSLGIHNVKHIEYPYFGEIKDDGADVKNTYELLAIGSTRRDKGLDILLEALNIVDKPFRLTIAGNANEFGSEFIMEKSIKYSERVRMYLKYLTDEEFEKFTEESDIVVLPYRRIFDGASGPLTYAVAHGKMVIGSAHGTLGEIISKNHLGAVFETENAADLAKALNNALGEDFIKDDYYKAYQKKINVKTFIEEHYKIYKIKEGME